MTVDPIREGFRAVTPYFFVEGAPRLIEFVVAAFDAQVVGLENRPDGTVMHAEIRINDSMIMMGEANDEFGPMPCSIYLYVTDCDSVYLRAIENGGVSVFEVMNLPSGERYGGVKDPCGNIWWIATHVEDLSQEEQEKRWREFKR